MANYQVYQDSEVENVHVKNNPVKLKESKVELIPRSVLGDIDRNKVQESKAQGSKIFDSKHSKFQEKDVSEAFKEVKLSNIDDENLENRVESNKPKERISLYYSKLNAEADLSASDVSLEVSSSETAENASYPHRIKIYTESLYDCLIYRDDIYSYLRELELKRKPKSFYMKKQPDITYAMRSILVDWLVEVSEEYKLQGETLFMAVSYVDRFLSTMAVVRSKLQLLGTSAMFIAAKYEEIYPPEVGEFTYITDDTYSKKQVLKMEQLILKTLNFDISVPTHHTFITHLTKVADIANDVSTMALYICELTLMEGDPYLQYAPSLVAAGALALARHCLGYADVWPADLAKVSGYTLQRHIAQVLPHLNQTHSKAPSLSLSASRDKYKSSKHHNVSCISHKPLIVRNPSTS